MKSTRLLFLCVLSFFAFVSSSFAQAKIKLDGIEETGSKTYYVAVGQELSINVRYENTIGDDLSIDANPDFEVEDADFLISNGFVNTVNGLNPVENGVGWENVEDNFSGLNTGELRAVETTFSWIPSQEFESLSFSIIGETDGTIQDIQITILPASANASVPSLSEWGIVFFILLILNLGLVTIKQTRLVTANGTMTMPSSFQFPFEKIHFLAGLKEALVAGIIGIEIIWLGWGAFTGTDIFGLGVSIFLLAYLLHLRKME